MADEQPVERRAPLCPFCRSPIKFDRNGSDPRPGVWLVCSDNDCYAQSEWPVFLNDATKDPDGVVAPIIDFVKSDDANCYYKHQKPEDGKDWSTVPMARL